ncbi:hypothetical protein CEP52_017522 [Fusarium oligoseptatum]|uniref:Uncharacterized protein n=1 Tax=Fusarium oligoseptatum TaxID=2604345 RepID=A0A428RPN1_9HYPO|nr:hypothetical protein CEP52_017522 [Fusarium oligoseptatum]
MSSDANLLALPYEVREQIFRHYFKLDRGYFYDGESEKLVTADDQPIDLSLMLVTPEMYSQIGLKFPQSMPNIRKHLTTHLQLMEQNNWQHERRFQYSSDITGGFITEYRGILNYTGVENFQWKWGTTYSSISGGIAYTLRLIAEKHPAEFAELIDQALPGWTDLHSPDEFFNLTFDPWAIPSLSELVATADQLQAYQLWKRLDMWHHHGENKDTGNRYRQKLYFSAAAVAIRFLNQLPEAQRLQIRNIIINEDRLAVGRSESHILGLIPFCRENPRLRVEQRVNLWRNLLSRMDIRWLSDAIKFSELGYADYFDHKLHLYVASSALASWGFHVMEVMGEGMPTGTFSFVLDGDPDLNLSSEVFDTLVHPSVAWLKAYTECSSRGIFAQPYQDIFYFPTVAYLQGIEPLLDGTSFLKTNFNVGQPWDYMKLVEAHQDLPFSAWRGKYYPKEPALEVSSPSLDWVSVRLEFVEKQRESDYLQSSLILSKREKKRLRRVRRRLVCVEEPEAEVEDSAEDDTEAKGQAMRDLFGDVHKAPPCMTRFEKKMYRKERRAQKAAASASDQTQADLTDIEDTESTIFGDFFEPRTGLWWW